MGEPDHWAVEVRINGERVLTIESDFLSGISDIDRHADLIRTCAAHLMAFIGTGEPTPCFLCGGVEACEPDCPSREPVVSQAPSGEGLVWAEDGLKTYPTVDEAIAAVRAEYGMGGSAL